MVTREPQCTQVSKSSTRLSLCRSPAMVLYLRPWTVRIVALQSPHPWATRPADSHTSLQECSVYSGYGVAVLAHHSALTAVKMWSIPAPTVTASCAHTAGCKSSYHSTYHQAYMCARYELVQEILKLWRLLFCALCFELAVSAKSMMYYSIASYTEEPSNKTGLVRCLSYKQIFQNCLLVS